MGGGQVSLESLRGKPVFMNYWASWCIPCRAEAPDLVNTWRRYRDTDLQMIGINTQDLQSDAKEFVSHYGLDYVNLRDSSGAVSTFYGVRAYPESFFISSEGLILEHVYGPMTSGEMASRIRRHFSIS